MALSMRFKRPACGGLLRTLFDYQCSAPAVDVLTARRWIGRSAFVRLASRSAGDQKFLPRKVRYNDDIKPMFRGDTIRFGVTRDSATFFAYRNPPSICCQGTRPSNFASQILWEDPELLEAYFPTLERIPDGVKHFDDVKTWKTFMPEAIKWWKSEIARVLTMVGRSDDEIKRCQKAAESAGKELLDKAKEKELEYAYTYREYSWMADEHQKRRN